MNNIRKFNEWRAMEISKVFLYKTGLKLRISDDRMPYFDLKVNINDNPDLSFAVEIKTNRLTELGKKRLIEVAGKSLEKGSIPTFIFLINAEDETGEFDYLINPLINKNLAVNKRFNLRPLEIESLKEKIGEVVNWYNYG